MYYNLTLTKQDGTVLEEWEVGAPETENDAEVLLRRKEARASLMAEILGAVLRADKGVTK